MAKDPNARVEARRARKEAWLKRHGQLPGAVVSDTPSEQPTPTPEAAHKRLPLMGSKIGE